MPCQAFVAERALASLAMGQVHIERGWLAGEHLREVRGAASLMLTRRGRGGTVGLDSATGASRLDASARRCLTVDLLSEETFDSLRATCPSLLSLLEQLDELRAELAARGRPLLPESEVQLLRYDVGGHYARHIDDGLGMAQQPVCRSVSLLLYLTPEDWSEQDGGRLRCFYGGEGAEPARHVDIPPAAGTLLLFDSATLPHEVLPTARERVVCVGWFLTRRVDRAGRPRRTEVQKVQGS